MRRIIVAIRDGRMAVRLNNAEVREDGIWQDGSLLVDGQARPDLTDEIKAACANQDYARVPAECRAHMGTMPSGLRVLGEAEWEAEVRGEEDKERAIWRAAHPGWQERSRIEGMYAAADRLQDYPGDYFPALGRADDALKAWRVRYPAEAAEERAGNLEAKAEGIQDNYCDLDGSLSSAEVDRLNVEREAERQELRRQAQEIRATSNKEGQ